MSNKILRDSKIWKVNGYKIHIERYDSEIIIKDEDGNVLNISKKDSLSILLNLKGSFKSN
jgi:hypothetical protein